MFIDVNPSMSFDSSWVNVLKYLCLHKNKIPSETGSLHDQTGPERCLSISCNSSSIPEIPTLHLEKQDLPVQVTFFRTEYRPVLVFTRLLKPVAAYLRKRGISLVLYLDGMLIIGSAFYETQQFTRITTNLLESQGFIINREKSILIPTQIITFLGFTINSI